MLLYSSFVILLSNLVCYFIIAIGSLCDIGIGCSIYHIDYSWYFMTLFQCRMATTRVLGTCPWDQPRNRHWCGNRILIWEILESIQVPQHKLHHWLVKRKIWSQNSSCLILTKDSHRVLHKTKWMVSYVLGMLFNPVLVEKLRRNCWFVVVVKMKRLCRR